MLTKEQVLEMVDRARGGVRVHLRMPGKTGVIFSISKKEVRARAGDLAASDLCVEFGRTEFTSDTLYIEIWR